jgi:hypothetical protein
MTKKPVPEGKSGGDRRSGVDRRKVDIGPPAGKPERRRSVEARKPEVVELDMTNSEWTALEGASGATGAAGATPRSSRP